MPELLTSKFAEVDDSIVTGEAGDEQASQAEFRPGCTSLSIFGQAVVPAHTYAQLRRLRRGRGPRRSSAAMEFPAHRLGPSDSSPQAASLSMCLRSSGSSRGG